MLDSRALAQSESEVSGDGDAQLAALRGENFALQSLLYGLCVALAQMSEVHREVIVQALDFARQRPANAAGQSEAMATLRDTILTRIRPSGRSFKSSGGCFPGGRPSAVRFDEVIVRSKNRGGPRPPADRPHYGDRLSVQSSCPLHPHFHAAKSKCDERSVQCK
jgi:hypothetical protein